MSDPEIRQLPDAAERRKIEENLDTNYLVEAAAGTGKTTSMIRRMVALIASGKARAHHIAAVTFTRKAASELKVRFVLQLEDAWGKALADGDDAKAALFADALENSGRCFVGTIHSFCARLLRERPVEAGVDPAFTEMDEAEDGRLRRVSWDEQMRGLTDEAARDRIVKAGLSPGELFGLFETVVGHPDVDRWPAPEPVPPDMSGALEAFRRYLAHIDGLLPQLPDEFGSDTLIPRMRRVRRMARNARDLSDPLALFKLLETFGLKVVARNKFYPGGKEQARGEAELWVRFNETVAIPAVRMFREYRYAVAIQAVYPAVDRYRHTRTLQGSLNYEDLLLKAAALLRENPGVRRFFQDRYRRLLVDEFQDTDPVQAEVMMFLTSTDTGERDWKNCPPRPGSLFVVGDPKQSIYRFRRADIMIYNEVRDIITGPDAITGAGGGKLELGSNFRSRPEILQWVNQVFEPCFPPEETDVAPRYVRLESGRPDSGEVPADLSGIRTVSIPGWCKNKQMVMEYEPERIARTIRGLVDSGATVTGKDGAPRPCAFGDFMVVTMKRAHLSPFSSALDRWSIPHQVSGGAALSEVPQLYDLYVAVRSAARPHDPVALVAVLKSSMFGFSDTDLMAYRLAGGEFRWDRPIPDGLETKLAERFVDVTQRLSLYARWLATLPVVPAMERMVEDLGLAAMAANQADGDLRVGSLYKALEVLRGAAAQRPLLDHVLETFRLLISGEEAHDGVAARPEPASLVRVMNLHKVKGLEAPVVFLATPVGQWSTSPSLHIVRDGDEVTGYAEVAGAAGGWGRPPAVALPPDWDDTWGPREEAFLIAELTRLLYVAATRAGSMLVVSRLEGKAGTHPWAFFSDHLEDAPELPDPEDAQPPDPPEEALGPDGDGDPSAYSKKWESLSRPGYEKSLPSRRAAPGKDPQPPTGEHGTGWGTVIHKLLEVAMGAAPDTPIDDPELEALAAAFLVEEDLPRDHAAEAVTTVRSVTSSAIWARALEAEQRLTEVPYNYLKSTDPMPVLESGVMDLVFKEDDGWVIVDYKTGSSDKDYSEQLGAYREAWESFDIGRVKEVGVLWVDGGEYEVLT
ncbi:MAG: UvrD-helicase domain-containing protein [bacterium]|nr:UvrD-helicase domain-containing protein [bacterium]